MKKSILVLIIFSFVGTSYSQYYKSWVNGTMINCSMQIFDQKKYVIILTSTEYEDNMQQTILSTGEYKQKKDTLYLTDHFLKYTFKFIKKGNQIVSVNGFQWMRNLIFKFGDESYDKDIHNFAKNPLAYFHIHSNENLKIHYPLFYLNYIFEDYSIILKKNNIYICKFGVLTLSEGHFKYNRNGLFFIDKKMGFSFSGIINYNSLYLNFLPFNNVLLGVRKKE